MCTLIDTVGQESQDRELQDELNIEENDHDPGIGQCFQRYLYLI